MEDKLLSLLGLCRKAGRLLHGFDVSVEAMKKREAVLILTARDLSPKSKKEITYFALKENTEVVAIPATIDDIAKKTGKRAGVLALTDKGFAAALKDVLSRVNEEE